MHKRRFLKLLSAGVLGNAAGRPLRLFALDPVAAATSEVAERSMATKHWMWVQPAREMGTDDEWKRRLEGWKGAGVDAILPEIFNNHQAHYGSDHLPVVRRWLEQLLPLAREAGLEVHAWMHTMTCNIASVHEAHPDWFNVNGKGESSWEAPAYVDYYRFLCPSRPEVHEFLARRVRELAGYEELTGIHLDYIRHPDVILASGLQPGYGIVQDREYPEYDYCYCDVCRNGFAAQSGLDPLEMDDPSASQAWRQYRCDLVTRIVNEHLVPIGRAAGKLMSAAVFPNWEHVRQQWPVWDLDAVLPMLYHSFYEEDLAWVGEQVRKGVDSLAQKIPLYSGLFVPAIDPEDLAAAVAVSMENGAAGVCLFANNAMEEGHWKAFAAVGRG